MRILAIDPSICSLGVALLDWQNLVSVWTLKTKSEWADRYAEIAIKLRQVIGEFLPDVLAIETQYLTWTMSNSVLKTCEVKGVCKWVFLSSVSRGRIFDIEPSKAKAMAGITGKRADVKKQMIEFVKRLFPQIRGIKVDDNGADAIAIGLACFSEAKRVELRERASKL